MRHSEPGSWRSPTATAGTAGMIYLKLRQAGDIANHKRIDRLYAEARLQVRRRRKKVPQADRQHRAPPGCQ
jgi:putative transposase